MAKTEASYETVMLFSLKKSAEEIEALTEKFRSLIAENGTVDSVEDWGKRRLAYPINYENDGYYVFMTFTCKPDFPAELDRVYKITDGIIRSLIVAKS